MKSSASLAPVALFPAGIPLSAERPASETWARRLLVLAAAWNILGGAAALLDPAKQSVSLFTTALPLADPLVLFFYRCTWINVIAWGAGYLLAAFLPSARLPVLAAGGAGKLFYFAACASAFASGAARPGLFIAGIADVAFAGLFLWILVLQQRRGPRST